MYCVTDRDILHKNIETIQVFVSCVIMEGYSVAGENEQKMSLEQKGLYEVAISQTPLSVKTKATH